MIGEKPEPLLWLGDSHGVYVPKAFADSFGDDLRGKAVSGVSDEDWKILEAGPDHEAYWDAWCEVEQKARITMPDGVEYTIYQEGDCWLIPVGMVWSEATEWFIWPPAEVTDA